MLSFVRRPRRASPALAGALLVVIACAGDGVGTTSDVSRVDSAGIEIVTSGADERPLDWTFEPVLTIGDDDGEYALGGGLDVAAGEQLIYVLDPMSHRVVVFDTTGTGVLSFGGKGGGPGEFEFPSGIMTGSDGSVGVFAYDKSAIVLFDSTGAPLEERRLPRPPQGSVSLLGDAPVYVGFPERSDDDQNAAPSLLALVVDRGTSVDTLARVPAVETEFFQLPDCGIGLNIPPLLSPEIVWAAAGDRIVYSDDTAMELLTHENGRVTRIVRRPLPPLEGTIDVALGEMRDTFRIRGGPYDCRIPAREVVEVQGYADVAPHVADIVVARNGGFWVRRRSADGTKPIDVFDASGAYVGTLPHDAPWPAAFMPDGSFLAVEADELDIPRVVRYRVAGGALAET